MDKKTQNSFFTQIPARDGKAAAQERGKWLLSLADLMTLLLAVIIVSAHLGAGSVNQSISSEPIGHEIPVGTAFAPTQEYVRREVVNFYPEDFLSGEQPLSRNATKRLKLLRQFGNEHPTSVQLKSCYEGVGEMNWHHSLSQVLTLYRQVFDNEKLAELQTISFHGPYCEPARVPYLGASVTVEFIWKQSNG